MAEYRIKGLANAPQVQYRIKGLANQAPVESIESPEKSFTDIPRDLGLGALNAALDLPGYAANILSDARDVPHQIRTNPMRAIENLGAGLGNAAIGAFNLPYSGAQFLK